MANVRLPASTRNTLADQITALIDLGSAGGKIKIYSGTQPATGGGGLSGNTLLGTLTFSTTSFGASSSGTITASAITSDTSADATGTATWARITDSDDNVVFDCDVATSGATVTLDNVSITTGGTIACTAFTVTMPAS